MTRITRLCPFPYPARTPTPSPHRVDQVHEHGGVAVAAVGDAVLVEEVVPVRVVLLVVLVAQHLQPLSVAHGHQRPRGDALLNALDDLLRVSWQGWESG